MFIKQIFIASHSDPNQAVATLLSLTEDMEARDSQTFRLVHHFSLYNTYRLTEIVEPLSESNLPAACPTGLHWDLKPQRAKAGLCVLTRLTLSYTGFFRLVLHGGRGGRKCPQPFYLKRLKLLQSNLAH